MGTAETRSLIDDWRDALNARDTERIAALLAEDCVWYPPSSAPQQPVRGRSDLVEMFSGRLVKDLFDLSKPFSIDVHRVLADGDHAVVQQRLRATAKATGEPYENEYCWVYEIRDGQIAQMDEYADTLVASRIMAWE